MGVGRHAADLPGVAGAGAWVARCHDVALIEGLLLAAEGCYGEPRSAEAAHARLHGLPVPADRHDAPEAAQGSLFDPSPRRPSRGSRWSRRWPPAQAARIAGRCPNPGGSGCWWRPSQAGGLIAAEMGHDGMPWRESVHQALLTELLRAPARPRHAAGPSSRRSPTRCRPRSGRRSTPTRRSGIVKAFRAAGVAVPSARSHVLKEVDHPGWRRCWRTRNWPGCSVSTAGSGPTSGGAADGRFRTEYVVGGVVSGRWATSGGGALQIPKVMRRAVVADEGWTPRGRRRAQLEPRVLAAMAGDRGLARAAGEEDLYAALATAFGGQRDAAKIAMLSAMYGGTSGDAPKLLAVMRNRFPQAYAVRRRRGARRGRRAGWSARGWAAPARRSSTAGGALVSRPDGAGRPATGGGSTRNFVVQGTAAEWALTLMAVLRGRG